MDLVLLTVPACPNAAAFEERLAAALAGHPGAVVRRREVADERQAAQAGVHRAPAPLIYGLEPFAGPEEAARPSFRAYPGPRRGTRPPPTGGSAPPAVPPSRPRLAR